MSDNQHHEYKCPICLGRMTLDIEPGRRLVVTHQLPACEESEQWAALVGGAVVEVHHKQIAPLPPCEHERVTSAAGDFCNHCGAELPAVA